MKISYNFIFITLLCSIKSQDLNIFGDVKDSISEIF